MDLKKALERNFVLKTEVGAGPRILGGMVRWKEFHRKRYRMNGEVTEDIIHEHSLHLGPVEVVRRGTKILPFGNEPYEITVTLFKLFAFSNDRELLVKLKAGPGVGVLRHILGLTPARAIAPAVDVDLETRAGMRMNVTRLVRDIMDGEDGKTEEESEDFDFN